MTSDQRRQDDVGFDDAPDGVEASHASLLTVRDLSVRYPRARGAPGPVEAVQGVELELDRGETLGLVGESGCGKTSLARAVMGLVPASGSVRLDGVELLGGTHAEWTAHRRRMQLVFQEPGAALNPRMRIGSALAEAVRVKGAASASGAVQAQVGELLERVGLPPGIRGRYPHELSGGQQQRVVIARALAVEPELLILDEPVSSLDVSVQAQILELLAELQRELGLAYLLVAHDLALVRNVCHRVAVMYAGRVVEKAEVEALFAEPLHPYTRILLDSVPTLEGGPAATPAGEPGNASVAPDVRGSDPDEHGAAPGGPVDEEGPSQGGASVEAGGASRGCPFYPRCPHPARNGECTVGVPKLEDKAPGHFAACVKARKIAGGGG